MATQKAGTLKVRRMSKVHEPEADALPGRGLELFGVDGVRSALGIRPDLPEPNRILVDVGSTPAEDRPALLFKNGRYSIGWVERVGEEPAAMVGPIIGW
ncbi:MAG: hypothetical protein WC943_13835, partial [Elusimicrobiota bacterium]